MIERAPARAAHFVDDAVEHLAVLLVLVEAFVEKMPQQPAALRHAPAVGDMNIGQRIRVGLVVFEEADDVARTGETRAHHARIAGAVDDIVDAA